MISRGIGKSAARSVARSLSQFGSGGGVAPSYDTDAQTYITAVETADGQSLETGVKDAINAFVVGCKSDGIWAAIKASCILAGARTLTGALVPLVGTAPTNNNFVSGDYSRTAGLTGDGSTKYLDSNRANNADPQDDKHLFCYVTQDATKVGGFCGTFPNAFLSGGSFLYRASSANASMRANNTSSQTYSNGLPVAPGGLGISRTSASLYTMIAALGVQSGTIGSATPIVDNIAVLQTGGVYLNATLAFYSIGESLDLALLDTRVTTLITDIGTALA